jgi:hypothetical protein
MTPDTTAKTTVGRTWKGGRNNGKKDASVMRGAGKKRVLKGSKIYRENRE